MSGSRSLKLLYAFLSRMGQTVPKVVEDEKTKWAADHALRINPEVRSQQLRDLTHFKSELYLCYDLCKENGIQYQHFFVTDNKWTIEFLSTGVQIHRNTLRSGYFVDATFQKTQEVEDRMSRVCGATAYSVTLRNCEHLGRYIYSGSWVSYQMLEGSYLGSTFVKYMMDEHLKNLNRLPYELRAEAPRTNLFPPDEYRGFLNYTGCPQGLSRADEEAFNILVVGPSGCGKSRLINLLFNREVAESRGSAMSITRQINIYSGTGLIVTQRRKVNVIDTIGLCDSHITADGVLELIKESLKVNFAFIDQVVVLCSGRIERQHSENIKQILEWLRHSQYPTSFTFLYNKVDQMPARERENHVVQMCQLLGIKRLILRELSRTIFHGDQVRARDQIRSRPPGGVFTVSKCLATGFPNVPFRELSDDLVLVLDSLFAKPRAYQGRIPVQESWCSIL